MAGLGGAPITTTTAERLERLRVLHLSGSSAADLRRHCRQDWRLSDRQARRLLALHRERLAADWREVRPGLLADLLARSEHVYRLALERDNLPVALGAIRTTARLAGLDGGAPSGAELIARLLEAIAAAPISSDARLSVRLSLAARGVMPPPDLSALTLQELDAFARHGAHGLLPSLLEAPAGSIAALADGDAVTGQAEP